jgi:protein-S-isoprenylcysteine O-methyltransferase Ste14
LRIGEPAWLALGWLLFFVPFVSNHLKVKRDRQAGGLTETRVIREPSSNWGLGLQFLAIAIVWEFRTPWRAEGFPWLILCWVSGTSLAWWALAHLHEQWRIQAVVAERHRLVQTGPYAIVRHPIYLALLLMLVGQAVAACMPAAAWVAVAIYLVGSEIRRIAEERILRERFGAEFDDFAGRTGAFVPNLWKMVRRFRRS